MDRLTTLLLVILLLAPLTQLRAADAPTTKPNIVIILADDLGYGDVHCLGGDRSKIATPHIDGLAAQGMIFKDAHSSSAVCTPTRYGILTGRYNWRSPLQYGVLGAYAPSLIAPDRLTLPAFLQKHGYHTACIGKWHLGWEWPKVGKDLDFTQPIKDGPTARGFDYYFGTDVPNYPPYCFIENDYTVGIPSVPLPAELRNGGLVRFPGPSVPDWSLEEILPTLATKASDYVAARAKTGEPFFLYLPLTSPHTPIAPTQAWKGKSGLSPFADFVMETDWAVGEVLGSIEKAGITDNTLVFFTSDNGAPPAAVSPKIKSRGHFSSADRRGNKADIFDGGHRNPFIVRWPGKIKPASECDQIICLTDLMATCAEILKTKLPDNAGEDSVSILPALLGTADKPLREATVHHSINGSFAIRQGQWKLVLCSDSGGWSDPRPGSKGAQKLPPVQLYNMTSDVGERNNVYKEHPEIVERLTKLLGKYVADGRSTPGATQTNDVAIKLRKTDAAD